MSEETIGGSCCSRESVTPNQHHADAVCLTTTVAKSRYRDEMTAYIARQDSPCSSSQPVHH